MSNGHILPEAGRDAPRRSLLRSGSLASLCLAAVVSLGAPTFPPGAPPSAAPLLLPRQSPDSARLLERAREEQARFERIRRRNSPLRRGISGGRPDEIVGRLGFSFGEGGWKRVPEPAGTVEAREKLLDTLARIGSAIPGDLWVLGQRVAYLGEAGRWSSALALLKDCPEDTGWECFGLRGFALHGARRYPQALEAFEEALERMEPSRAAEWTKLEGLVGRGARKLLRDAPDSSAARIRERIWLLGDPFFLVPGNDRRTEHYARHAMSWLKRDAAQTYSIRWGSDFAELLVRYGREVGWERSLPLPDRARPHHVTGHHHPEIRHYLPTGGRDRRSDGDSGGRLDSERRPAEERVRSALRPRGGGGGRPDRALSAGGLPDGGGGV